MTILNEIMNDPDKREFFIEGYRKLLVTELMLSVAYRKYKDARKICLELGIDDKEIKSVIRQIKEYNNKKQK